MKINFRNVNHTACANLIITLSQAKDSEQFQSFNKCSCVTFKTYIIFNFMLWKNTTKRDKIMRENNSSFFFFVEFQAFFVQKNYSIILCIIELFDWIHQFRFTSCVINLQDQDSRIQFFCLLWCIFKLTQNYHINSNFFMREIKVFWVKWDLQNTVSVYLYHTDCLWWEK